jgi:hypothetical protein
MAYPISPFDNQIYKNMMYSAAKNAWSKIDYVEGTWTPVISGDAGSATMVNAGTCWYIKQGRTVTIGGTVAWTGSTLSGMIRISGIPFTSRSVAYGGGRAAGTYGAITAGSFSFSLANTTHLTLVNDPGNSFIYIIESGASSYSHTPIVGSAGTIYGLSLTYQI